MTIHCFLTLHLAVSGFIFYLGCIIISRLHQACGSIIRVRSSHLQNWDKVLSLANKNVIVGCRFRQVGTNTRIVYWSHNISMFHRRHAKSYFWAKGATIKNWNYCLSWTIQESHQIGSWKSSHNEIVGYSFNEKSLFYYFISPIQVFFLTQLWWRFCVFEVHEVLIFL